MKRKFDFKGQYTALLSSIDMMFNSAASEENKKIAGGRSGIVAHDKGYVCIHLASNRFLHSMDFVKSILPKDVNNKYKFLDVGCGVGHKVFLAHTLLNFQAFGLDLRKLFVKRAEILCDSLLGRNQANFIHCNAFDYTDFGLYDVIYFYSPIADRQLESKLEQKIAAEAKKGAIVVGYLSEFFCHDNENWERLHNEIWKKIA
jgi:SAM-dependent methyltransferase